LRCVRIVLGEYMNQKLCLILVASLSLVSLDACSSKSSSNDPQPLVSKAIVKDNGTHCGEAVDSTNAGCAVGVQITFDKSILTQEFLYGADLQSSDSHDDGDDLYNQSMAIGHIPVNFRIVGNELQLIADNTRLSPSDINHPELLISHYPIISQDANSLTVSGADSSIFLAEISGAFSSPTATTAYDPTAPLPKQYWIRSFDFAPQGNYFLQQTTIVTADGHTSDFMESVFPRSTLNPSPDFIKLPLDPVADRVPETVADADFFNRFRYLGGETIFQSMGQDAEPVSLAYGQHPDIGTSAGSVTEMDWYVTPNAPDEILPVLKNAVEAWNRYFRVMKGYGHDVLSFKGKLPNGIYMGDPRYNVIRWDSVRAAGAAYESQASDPDTGKQSHSLIYMPAAWLAIGNTYWAKGQYSDSSSQPVAGSQKIGRSTSRAIDARLSCMRDVSMGAAVATSGRLSPDEAKEFSISLLKQTLFHEVGHALGFAHEFKGSLANDPSKPGSMFSWSIMDYNDYEIERRAFDSVDVSTGPLLEYDRQFLSAVYDKKQENLSTDQVIPACADAEADNTTGGVDPLCIRYDVENDPTHSITTALDRINLATKPNDVTLIQALANAQAQAISPSDIQNVKTSDDLDALEAQITSVLASPIAYYYYTSDASLRGTVKTNVKALMEYEDGILPDAYNSSQMRARAFDGIQKTLASIAAPDAVKQAYQASVTALITQLQQSPYLIAMTPDDQKAKTASVQTALNTQLDAAVKTILQQTRLSVVKALVAPSGTAFYFLQSPTTPADSVDYQKDLVGLLLTSLEKSTSLSSDERTAAATSLMTFKGQLFGDPAIATVVQELTSERAAATTSADRDAAQALLQIMTASPAATH
jgi:hypothetical protein